MTSAAGRIEQTGQDAIRQHRRRTSSSGFDRPDPTPEQRRALWREVYEQRVPTAWRRCAPERDVPWADWSARYVEPVLAACVRITSSSPLEPSRLKNLSSVSCHDPVRKKHPLDEILRHSY
ncbi:MAG: hypothetical protein OXF98_13960, partial [Rhodospirillaceae bacterium]|nr:hypothetical protein [Rhodospirillaceae bacterium]